MRSSDPFYRLDNSAILTAALADEGGPFVFRLWCVLDGAVDAEALAQAMERLAPRFPFFHVSMGRGVFWHYLNPLAKVPKPVAEGPHPAEPMPYGRGRPLFRVSAYGRRIACEFHHAITDGYGALSYLRALVCEYCAGLGASISPEELDALGIPRASSGPDREEGEDSYARYFAGQVPHPDRRPQAFLLPGWRRMEGYRQTLGLADVEAMLPLARRRGASLTEYLAAAFLASLQDVYEALPPGRRRRANPTLSVQIPINLRKLYPSRSLRNFTLFASPTLDLRLGHWDFGEIVSRVHHELRLGLSTKELSRQLGRNVGGERNIVGRSLFLPLKTMALRRINSTIGVSTYSGSVSNLGEATLPEAAADRVSSIGFLPARASVTGANLGVISWNGRLAMTVGSLVVDRAFERAFFRRVADEGVELDVACNEAYEGASE